MFLFLKAAVVSSPCPLLPAERADEYLPQGCMQVPARTAWVPLQINVANYADASGELKIDALKAALIALVDDGERLHDSTHWEDPRVEYDSWLNRRLAIALRGWGDLALLRGADPGALQTLRDFESLANWASNTVRAQSRVLAETHSWCPALDEVSAKILRQNTRSRWGSRWRQAIAEVALRHRNLTTLSPWDVFPRGTPADLKYADLLPLTRFADTLSFQSEVCIRHWNANDFKGFYERVAAEAERGRGAALVAKEV